MKAPFHVEGTAMVRSPSVNLSAELSHYGINSRSESVRWFSDAATPDSIEYLDLIEPQGTHAQRLVKPDGVVENQDRPLLFFINQGHLAQCPDEQQQIQDLRRSLACRGDRAYLAVVRPGTLDVVPVSLKDQTLQWKEFKAGTPEALTFFSRLALGRCEELPAGKEVDFLFKEMFELVDKTATRLEQLKLKRTDVVSLVGRALFFRFLADRSIVKDTDLKKICPGAASLLECFDNAENATATSRWLDKTFNGDFLPLTDEGCLEFFESLGQRTGKRVFSHLGAIARGEEPSGDDGFQLRLKIDWGDLDFAHIPVGLLSQVYERLSWKWDRKTSKNNSVHYTPRNIAATLVGEAFDNLPNAHSARVLDPACGASVFLVIAFRRLYRELWQHTGKRPDTAAIRSILENQLVGFDISDSALKFSALSLYLTAIELDPDPVPPEKLKFKALRKGKSTILFDWRKEDDKEKAPVVGSVGRHVGDRFDSGFDLVLCNPPWTNIGSDYSWVAEEINEVSQAVVNSLDPEIGKTYQNPDSVPDLPFVWKSMQWCRPDGRIAMALPARTLFKQGKMAETTRKALFSLLEVNGIINGSNLRKTEVWPDMDQPFMLLFARNRRPKSGHRLHFISPHTDLQANSLGEMRIDSKSARPVDVEDTFAEPWLWKALAVGTVLDVEVIRKIKAAGFKSLQDYWENELSLVGCNGYQIKENQKDRQDATKLHGLPNLNSPGAFRFVVDTSELAPFQHATAFRTRLRERKPDPLMVYRGPLALIKESLGADRSRGRAVISYGDIAYSESFYGYSSNGYRGGAAEAEDLVKYLQLFVHSQLWIHYALVTSAKLGFERPNFEKKDIDGFPLIPMESMDLTQRMELKSLSARLLADDMTVFPAIDHFFGTLYDLSKLDIEVIADTLEVRDPNDELGRRASQMPTASERGSFFRRIESHVRPLFKALGKQPEVAVWKPSEGVESPFLVFTLSVKGQSAPDPTDVFRMSVLPLANETGATQIIKESSGGLIIGILRQYRYWTPSRARLLGGEIIRSHMTLFED